jgi:hypothetical protein
MLISRRVCASSLSPLVSETSSGNPDDGTRLTAFKNSSSMRKAHASHSPSSTHPDSEIKSIMRPASQRLLDTSNANMMIFSPKSLESSVTPDSGTTVFTLFSTSLPQLAMGTNVILESQYSQLIDYIAYEN